MLYEVITLTTNQDNTVGAINELFTSVGNGKTVIAAAIRITSYNVCYTKLLRVGRK